MNKNEKMKTINPAKFVSEYGTIRAVRENDDILFVGVDVANAFGFGNTRPMAYCKNPTKRRIEIRDGDKLKSVTTGTCINSDDCMQLYYASKLRKADRDAVKAFIFESIIPALTYTGVEDNEVDELRSALKRAKEYFIETEKENAELRRQLTVLMETIQNDPCSLCRNRR